MAHDWIEYTVAIEHIKGKSAKTAIIARNSSGHSFERPGAFYGRLSIIFDVLSECSQGHPVRSITFSQFDETRIS